MNEEAVIQLVFFIVRILITIHVVKKAGAMNRSKGGWGFFGFFLPIVAIIWIQFMKPKMLWDQSDQRA